MRLLLLNLATDADDPVLGFTTRWIQEIAKRVESVDVVTMRAGRVQVPENVRVYSLGKEMGYGEPRRAFELQRHLLGILRRVSIDVCFSHMSPILTVAAAPLLKLRGVPIVTWYAHRQVTMRLKLAHRLSNLMVSINETSYRYRRDKFLPLGHGIDVDLFSANGTGYERPPLLLSVGRFSPIKDHVTLVEAVGVLRTKGHDLRCALVGGEEGSERDYGLRVRSRVTDLGLNDVVQFVGPIPQGEVVRWYERCFVHVNLCPTGALDKAPLEAMACGKASLVSNEGFRDTLGRWVDPLMFRHGSKEDLADKIEDLLERGDEDREAMAADLSLSITVRHSLDRLADRLVEVLESTAAGRKSHGGARR